MRRIFIRNNYTSQTGTTGREPVLVGDGKSKDSSDLSASRLRALGVCARMVL